MSERIAKLIDSIEGGVAKGIDELVREYCDCELTDLLQEETTDIDLAIFECQYCNWTMPVDSLWEESDDTCDQCGEEYGD